MNDQQRKVLDEISRKLTDDGKLIEVGWRAMHLLVLPPNSPPVQVDEMRKAFFMGAQHLFASITSIMEEGVEPTEKDFDRMTLIHNELEAFRMEVTNVHTPGRA
jgi:hypothetical protein